MIWAFQAAILLVTEMGRTMVIRWFLTRSEGPTDRAVEPIGELD